MANRHLQQVMRQIRKLVGAPGGGDASDGQLLESFVTQKDQAAFEALLERHGPMVQGVCRRVLHDVHLAEDAFQATFLVLVRKAGSLRQRDRVGNWLYGVAWRVAHKARAQTARRPESRVGRVFEAHQPGRPAAAAPQKEMLNMSTPDPTSEADWRELRPLLDEEVQGLPDKYREPFVLCYLEGKTNAEAARHMGCLESTVIGRLARARERLRSRLSRRGLALSTGALTTLVAQNATAAAVPTALFCSTTQAAMGILAASTVAGAGGVSALTAALMEGVLHEMFLTKIKIAALLLLSVAFAGGTTGVVFHQALAGKPGAGPATAQGADPAKPPAKEADPAKPPAGAAPSTPEADENPKGKAAKELKQLYQDTGWVLAGKYVAENERKLPPGAEPQTYTFEDCTHFKEKLLFGVINKKGAASEHTSTRPFTYPVVKILKGENVPGKVVILVDDAVANVPAPIKVTPANEKLILFMEAKGEAAKNVLAAIPWSAEMEKELTKK